MELYPEGRRGDAKLPGDPIGTVGHPGSYWGHESETYRKGEELGAWRIVLVDVDVSSGAPVLTNRRTITLPAGYTLIGAPGSRRTGRA